MKLLLLLSSLVIVDADIVKPANCDGVVINNVYHELEILKTGFDRPYFLSVDHSTNTLYFSFTENMSTTARINLNTKEYSVVSGVQDGFAQSVDRTTNDVYIGGSDGVYKLNKSTNKAELFGAKGVNVWSLFVKDTVYYTDFPGQFLYNLIDDVSTRFHELEDTKVDQFIIDDDEYIFFTNATGLYGLQKGSKDAVLYSLYTHLYPRGISMDNKGNTYICLPDGIFAINKSTTTLEKVVDLTNAFGVAFDKEDNMIYADDTSIVRLKANKSKSC